MFSAQSTSTLKSIDVPRLHPGVNDLVRVLGKQAHCSSRTLISCEPTCPKAYSQSKYHKNCASPKPGRSWDSLCRPSSLWSPVPPDTYYYDCFFYRQYPDRDSEYQEIEEKYKAIKQEKLDYSPPECDQDKIHAMISEPTLESKTKMYERSDSNDRQGKSSGRKRGGDDYSSRKGYLHGKNDLSGKDLSSDGEGYLSGKDDPSGNESSSDVECYLSEREDQYRPSSNKKKPLGSGSKAKMVSEGDSVPCSELAEIRDLLKKSDRETILRMQEMLTLMKEMSVRDICRARCDGGTMKADETANEQTFTSSGLNKRSQMRDAARERRKEEPDYQDRSYSHVEYLEDEAEKPRKPSQKRKQGAHYDRRYESTRTVQKKRDEGDSEDSDGDSTYEDDTARKYAAESTQYASPATKKQHGSSKKTEQDDASDASSTTQGREGNGRKGKKSSRNAKSKGHKQGSGSDTDTTEESSSPSDFSTDESQSDFRSEEVDSDMESSGIEDVSNRSLRKQSLAKGMKKIVCKDNFPTPDTLINRQRSTGSLSPRKSTISYDQEARASKPSAIPSKYSSKNDQPATGGNFKLTVGNDQLTVHEVVELSNKITDIIVLETMDKLMQKGLYVPPGLRSDSGPDRPTMSKQPGGPSTSPTQPTGDRTFKGGPNKLNKIEETLSQTGLSSLGEPGGGMEKCEKRVSQESRKSNCPRHSRSHSSSPSCRLELERERARSASPQHKKPGPPEPWQRRLSSQMEADTRRESAMLGKPAPCRVSTTGRKQSSVSGHEMLVRPSERVGELDPLAQSSKWSTTPYKTDLGIPDGNRDSYCSQADKTKSDVRLDQSTVRKPDNTGNRTQVSKPKQSIQVSRPDILEDSVGCIPRGQSPSKPSQLSNANLAQPIKSIIQVAGAKHPTESSLKPVQHKTTTKEGIETPGSRRSSKISEMSKASLSKNSRLSKIPLEKKQSLQGPGNKPQLNLHDKARLSSARGQQVGQGANVRPDSTTKKEVSRDRVTSFTRTENVGFEPNARSSRASVPQISQIASACEPDDLIAKTYSTDDSILYYARITRNAFPPIKESYHAAGFMLRSAYDYTIPPRSKVNVKTDLLLQLPRNSYGRIAPRKCLVESYAIDVGADVIDRDFKGNINVVLFNHGNKSFTVHKGNKVAQLICESIHLAKVVEDTALLKG